jgi:hypothetical protein
MIRLINAATNLVNNHNKIYTETKGSYSVDNFEISNALRELVDSGINHPAIDRIVNEHDRLVATIEQMMPSPDDISAIAEERGHFNARRKSNNRTREFMQSKRRKEREELETPAQSYTFDDDAEVDLDVLYKKIIAFRSAYPFKSIDARVIMETAASLGAKSLDLQLSLLQQLIDQGKIKEGEFGVYEIAENENGK